MFSRETEPTGHTHTHTHTHTQIYFEELSHLIVGLENPTCVGQVGSLEIQIIVDTAALSLNSAGHQAGNSGRVSVLHS